MTTARWKPRSPPRSPPSALRSGASVRPRHRSWCARPWAGRRPTCSPACSIRPPPRRRPRRSPRAYEGQVAAGGAAEMPGARDVLRALRRRGVAVCLTTGFAPSTRDALLDALGWRGDVDLALSPADVGRGRPAPDMILGAMARLARTRPGRGGGCRRHGERSRGWGAGRRRGGRRRLERRPRRSRSSERRPTPRSSPTSPSCSACSRGRRSESPPSDLPFSTKTETCSIIAHSQRRGCAPHEDVTHGRCGAHAPGDGAGRHGP